MPPNFGVVCSSTVALGDNGVQWFEVNCCGVISYCFSGDNIIFIEGYI
jgi:hypothetical protein